MRTASSFTGNGRALHAQRWRIGAVAENEIVGRRKPAEHVLEIAGDRHTGDRPGDLAVFDPETGSTAAVIAGYHVDAHADQLCYAESLGDVRDEVFRSSRARFHVKVCRGRRGWSARS